MEATMKASSFIAATLIWTAAATGVLAQPNSPFPPANNNASPFPPGNTGGNGGGNAGAAPAAPGGGGGGTTVFGGGGAAAPAEFSAAASYGMGQPQYGYQFCYGSFVFGGTARGIFALSSHQFPQGYTQKLYEEDLTFLQYNPSGPYQGAIFYCTVNGNTLYIIFGTINYGSSGGVPLRQLRYYDGYGTQLYSTYARFYSP
jgi:hypothetical protein